MKTYRSNVSPDVELPGRQAHPSVALDDIQLLAGEQLPVICAVDDAAEHILEVGDIVGHIGWVPPLAGCERVMLGQRGWS